MTRSSFPRALATGARVRGARIAGIGAARPPTVVGGSDLIAPFGKDEQWLRARTGITELRRLAGGEDLLPLAVEASRSALSEAGVDPSDVGAVLVASCSANTPGRPGLSERLAAALGLHAVPMELNSACAGFCYALDSARSLVRHGGHRAVLVVGAEQMSRLVDPGDLGTSILFGDGAGAVVVVGDDDTGIAAAAWSSDGSGAGLLEIPPGTRHMTMAGQQVFRWAVDRVHHVASAAIARAGIRASDIEVFVPHQANLRIVESIARALKLDTVVVADDVRRSGNTSAASIPLALHALRREGRVRTGQLALFIGYGAGLAIAGQVVRLP